jgi:hypothetical protein
MMSRRKKKMPELNDDQFAVLAKVVGYGGCSQGAIRLDGLERHHVFPARAGMNRAV